MITQTRAVAAGMGDKKTQKAINKEIKEDQREERQEEREKEYIKKMQSGEKGKAPSITFEDIIKREKEKQNGR